MSFVEDNPNNWVPVAHEFRIYADDNAFQWAVVDEEDYLWAVRWRWHINKPHPTRNGNKLYMKRNIGRAGRYEPALYLHVEIMKRTGERPPDWDHVLVDHIDGDELNCRRINLRWATHSLNRRNQRK